MGGTAPPSDQAGKSPIEKPAILNVEGDRVALGPLRRALLPLYQRWNNDFATTRTTASSRPTTIEQEAAAYDRVTADASYALFTIYDRATWQPIGLAYLADIDYRNRSAEFGVVIGEAVFRGKGYGTETTRLVLDYAFTALGLHNVVLTVAEFNLAGRRACEKAGFKEIGRRRQCRQMGGRLWDSIYMECRASKFTGAVQARVFLPDAPRSPAGGPPAVTEP